MAPPLLNDEETIIYDDDFEMGEAVVPRSYFNLANEASDGNCSLERSAVSYRVMLRSFAKCAQMFAIICRDK